MVLILCYHNNNINIVIDRQSSIYAHAHDADQPL